MTNKHNKAIGPPGIHIRPLEITIKPPIWCTANTCSLSQLKPQAGCSPVNDECIRATVIVTYNRETPACVGWDHFHVVCGLLFLSEINACVPSCTQTQLHALRGYCGSALMCSSLIIRTLLCPIRCRACQWKHGIDYLYSIIKPMTTWKGTKQRRNYAANGRGYALLFVTGSSSQCFSAWM